MSSRCLVLLIAVFLLSPSLSLGQETKPELLSIWEKTRYGTLQERRAAIWQLEKIGDNAVPLLMEIWHHGDPEVAPAAATVIGRLKPRSQRIAQTFQEALTSSNDSNLREAAAIALGGVQGDEEDSVKALCAGLKDKEPKVVYWSAISLREFGPSASQAAPHLIEVVKHYYQKGDRVKSKIGHHNFDLEIAIHALNTLSIVDPKNHEEFIVQTGAKAMQDHSKSYIVGLVGSETLERMGRASKIAVPVLLEIVDENTMYKDVRDRAMEAIIAITRESRARPAMKTR